MKWEGGEESSNVEDRRGMSPGLAVGGGGSVLLVVLALVFGLDPRQLVGPGGLGGGGNAPVGKGVDDKEKKFLSTVLRYTEKVWTKEFRDRRADYRVAYQEPKLVIFSTKVNTGCGTAPSAVGPFYCPADQKLYIDPTFFDELQNKLGGSKGEFSQAYVLAHEIGHHVQRLLGYADRVDAARGTREENAMSVRLELQADYLAGVWANKGQEAFQFIESGDVDGAVKSANSIGDDTLQKRGGGWASPEKYTHGTSAQRVRFFTEGLKTGDASRRRLDQFFSARMNNRGELE